MLIMLLVLIAPALLEAQYAREVPSIPGLSANRVGDAPSILGIDISRINFENSYSMQVSSFGDNTVAMGLLRSSFNYVINPQVSVKGYVGLIHSPFSSMAPMDQQSSFANGLNKDNMLYGGEITYRPTENMLFHLSINRLPVNTQRQFYSPYNYLTRGY
jgi:hypothetical protein